MEGSTEGQLVPDGKDEISNSHGANGWILYGVGDAAGCFNDLQFSRDVLFDFS
jgi:hypothetical protein